jgi:hypothetical protein
MTTTEQPLRPDQARILDNAHHTRKAHPIHRIAIPHPDEPFVTFRSLPTVPTGCLLVLEGYTRDYRYGQTLCDAIESGRPGAIALRCEGDSTMCVVMWSQLPTYHPGQSFRLS